MDKDVKEHQKLKKLHKKETRSAIRELRKDAKFVANVRQEEKREFDKDRDAVTKRVENQLAGDLGTQRQAIRKKELKKGVYRK